jgi:integrase
MKRPFLLAKRGRFWYYRLSGELTFHTTGATTRAAAERWVIDQGLLAARKRTDATLREYSEPFYTTDRDPRVLRRREEGRTVSAYHLHSSRKWIETYVLKDPIAGRRMREITRADLLEYRRRLIEKVDGRRNTANKVMGALKTIFREAIYLQDLQADPTAGIGLIKEERVQPGVLTADELRALFTEDGTGPWADRRAYTCFLIAATTGMRRGEVLSLRWRDVDLEASSVRVDRAWKFYERTDGLPKSGKSRLTPIPAVTVRALELLQEEGIRNHPDDLVICYEDGNRMGETWWKKRFAAAVVEAKIVPSGRHLVPHSLRHSMATLLASQEVAPEKIRAALGWSGEAIRANYTHLGAEHLRDVADALGRVLEGSKGK